MNATILVLFPCVSLWELFLMLELWLLEFYCYSVALNVCMQLPRRYIPTVAVFKTWVWFGAPYTFWAHHLI